jgi:hypothetical protein
VDLKRGHKKRRRIFSESAKTPFYVDSISSSIMIAQYILMQLFFTRFSIPLLNKRELDTKKMYHADAWILNFSNFTGGL